MKDDDLRAIALYLKDQPEQQQQSASSRRGCRTPLQLTFRCGARDLSMLFDAMLL
jgi:hypothetical protein